jgi:hypothetical protein
VGLHQPLSPRAARASRRCSLRARFAALRAASASPSSPTALATCPSAAGNAAAASSDTAVPSGAHTARRLDFFRVGGASTSATASPGAASSAPSGPARAFFAFFRLGAASTSATTAAVAGASPSTARAFPSVAGAEEAIPAPRVPAANQSPRARPIPRPMPSARPPRGRSSASWSAGAPKVVRSGQVARKRGVCALFVGTNTGSSARRPPARRGWRWWVRSRGSSCRTTPPHSHATLAIASFAVCAVIVEHDGGRAIP